MNGFCFDWKVEKTFGCRSTFHSGLNVHRFIELSASLTKKAWVGGGSDGVGGDGADGSDDGSGGILRCWW